MGRNFEQIIEEQVQAWARSRQRRGRSERPYPIITISREFGAQGAALARLIGDRTGFSVWDQELVQAIADEAGGDDRLMRSLDEFHRNAIDDAVRGALMGTPHTNMQYLRALMRVVYTIAHHGNAIIVGRGANFIARPSSTLRVRVVRPLEERARYLSERKGISDREARRLIAETDAARSDFIRSNFRRNIADPVGYDLLLNMESFSLEKMAEFVAMAYEAKLGRPLPVVA